MEQLWKTNWLSTELSSSVYSAPVDYLVPNGYIRSSEVIEDEDPQKSIGYVKDDNYIVPHRFQTRLSKPCVHSQETNEFDGSPIRHLSALSGNTNVPIRRLTVSHINALVAFALGTVTDFTLDSYAQTAVDAMRPKLAQGVSLLNFVLELKDLKHWGKVGNALERIHTRSRRWDDNRPKARRRFGDSLPYSDISYRMPKGRKKMLKDIVQRLTGAHLEASFGIVPFVSDVVSTIVQLSAFEYNLSQLKRYANTPQRRRYRRYIPNQDGSAAVRDWRYGDVDAKTYNNPYGNDEFDRPPIYLIQRARWIRRPVYHATMDYIYSLPDVTEAELKVRGLFDVLGLKLDPGIAWDAVPYTFVIDWVADVSAYLHSFARNNLSILLSNVQFCHSVAWHYEAEVVILCQSKSPTAFFPPPTWWTQKMSNENSMGTAYRRTKRFYERRLSHVNANDTAHVLSIKTPTLREIGLSGSLLVNKRLGGTKVYRGKR